MSDARHGLDLSCNDLRWLLSHYVYGATAPVFCGASASTSVQLTATVWGAADGAREATPMVQISHSHHASDLKHTQQCHRTMPAVACGRAPIWCYRPAPLWCCGQRELVSNLRATRGCALAWQFLNCHAGQRRDLCNLRKSAPMSNAVSGAARRGLAQ